MTFDKFMELLTIKNMVTNMQDNTKDFDSIEDNEYIKVNSASYDKARRKRLKLATIFALFLPYTRQELTGEIIENEQPYPHQFRQVKMYRDYPSLLDAYANTPCPASQMIIALDEKDYQEQLELWNKRYDDEEWLEKNLYPYL